MKIIAEIRPSEERPDGPPLKIIRRSHSAKYEMPVDKAVRACQHGKFTLDEKWKTVTCGLCGDKVDPFSVLAYVACWREDFERQRELVTEAEKSLHIEELRRLRKLRGITVTEAKEIDAALSDRWALEAKQLGEVSHRIENALKERKR